MKWIAISGSWRKTTEGIERKIRRVVKEILKKGNGIVTGGALGVDYIAVDEALKYDKDFKKIKIFLPTTLKKYIQHLEKHFRWGTIKKRDADTLVNQLKKIKKNNPQVIIETKNINFTEKTKKKMYYQRNSNIVENADELIAFRVITKESRVWAL